MPLRILHVLPCRFFGGPEKQTLQVARALRERYGHESIFCVMPHPDTLPERNPLVLRVREEGFETEPFVMRNNYNLLEGIHTLKRFIRRYHPNVVCSVGYKANLLTALGANIPTVAVIHGWTGQDWKVKAFEWLDQRTLRRHSAIIVVSETQRRLVRRLGVRDERIHWAPNAIDVRVLLRPYEKTALLRETCEASEPAWLIGSVGRLSPEKGHRVLLDAFGRVRAQMGNVKLLLVGDGPEAHFLQGAVSALSLQKSVIFTGLRADAQQIIGALDLLVLPSLTEGLPVVILEAFAYETPVVATAVGGVPELVKDGETGWLVPPRDPHALAQAILDALSNPEEARRRAENAYKHLLENFTLEKQVDKWEQALQAAVEGRKT
jgi:glycosyltransferase involved in cell wall biosynthesis